jgi:extracellular elastinolytic metalloproteinase
MPRALRPSPRRAARRRALTAGLAAVAAAAIAVVGVPQAQAAGPNAPAARPDTGSSKAARAGDDKQTYDVRAGATAAQRRAFQRRAAQLSAKPASVRLRRHLGRQGVFSVDGLTGTPREVARLDGFLTGRSNKPARQVALDYVRANLASFGLTAADLDTLVLRRDYVDIAGIHHLSWIQVEGGLPVFGNGLQANVTRRGELINVLGSPVASLSAPAGRAGTVPTGKAAIKVARTDLGEKRTSAGRADTAQAVLFQTASGTRRAWKTITMSAARPALHVIDAVSGAVLYRQSLTDDLAAAKRPKRATGKAFQYFPKAPRGGKQINVDFTRKGWLPAGATILSGNNTHTFADVNDGADGQIDTDVADPGEEIPPRHGNSWDYRLVPFQLPDVSFCDNPFPCNWDPNTPFSWQTNRNQDATQVFYYANNWHDHLAAAPIGFTEAAGNFQNVNRTGQGEGGDAVSANTDDGANSDIDGDQIADGLPDGNHIDNANMSTPPDGTPPTMQMYLQHQPFTTYPDEDPFAPTNVGDEADTVYHEYTHGLSNRLVIDAAGDSTLGDVQAGAMGEAWSDWYAMDYLNDQGFQPDRPVDGDVVLFQYDGAGVALDRTEPMDCPVGSTSPNCPGTDTAGPGGYTYGDYGKVVGSPEVHGDGEIWAQTLWDLRRVLGSRTSESLVTRAMELSPANPSFLNERNSILLADEAVFGGRHVDAIWGVFAHRGMGFFAAALDGNDAAPGEDFSLPPAAGTPVGTLTGTVSDPQSGTPIAGATVIVATATSLTGTNPSATTDADGHYTITGLVAGHYPKVVAASPGFDGVTTDVTVTGGTTTADFSLRRDWASSAGGASIPAFDGPVTEADCGPPFAIDQTQVNGWESTADLVGGKVSPQTPKSITIALPKPVTISEITVDPSNTCADGGSAATGGYKLETSSDGGTTWTLQHESRFTIADRGRLNTVPLDATASLANVTTVRFTMEDPQVFDDAVGGPDACPGAFSGCDFVDMSEIEVYGT